MPESNPQRDVWLTVLFVLLLLAGLAVLALGVWLAVVRAEFVILAIGLLCVGVPAAIYAVAGRGGVDPVIVKQLQDQVQLLQSINERLLISDQAKRIAFRQNDREALRKAILEDVRTEDYDAALALVKEMGETYGYREDAEHFRQQILEAQNKKREAVVHRAIAQLDDVIARYDWERARHEVARLRRLYHDYPGINELPARVERAREAHKVALEQQFLEAAQRDDVDRAKELMKELDRYLTPQEAEPFLEIARGVVGKWKDNLGVRFKWAVRDRDWIEALNIGEQIMREFPNSQFAKEVRNMLDTLRERAAGQRAAMAEGQSV